MLDVAKFIFRIIFASFVKDAMFAVFSPDKFRTPVPEKLISMVESETLDQVRNFFSSKSCVKIGGAINF